MTESHFLATPQTTAALFAQWRPYWDLTRPFLLEKTPITLLRTRFFQSLFPNSHFVVIIRHPAPVALATYNALASFGAADGLTMAHLIEHWLIWHEIFRRGAPRLRRLCVLKYEDFVAAPQAVADATYVFLGLPSHPVGEAIEPDINGRYRVQWRAMRRDPARQALVERATH